VKLQVLGCAGGIGGLEQFTTCFLLDDDILIDAGSGLTKLSVERLSLIDHIFITHSHLDHVFGLAVLVDTVLGRRNKPVIVHASEEVIATLNTHLFNWKLWPDFSVIPTPSNPILLWDIMPKSSSVEIDGRIIESHNVNHTVDAVGYWVHNPKRGFLFTGDMATTPELWSRFRNEEKLRQVIIDCSFPNTEIDIAQASKHYCPQTLIADVANMPASTQFLVTHLKPGQENLIMEELRTDTHHQYTALSSGTILEF
jgi:3',5'-cyclic-nucleotide phosphodiesterase